MDSFYTTCNQIDTDLGLNLYHDHHDYLVMPGVEGFEQTTFPVLLDDSPRAHNVKNHIAHPCYLIEGNFFSQDNAEEAGVRTCPSCGHIMHINDRVSCNIRHLPIGRYSTVMKVNSIQYYCPHCQNTYKDSLPFKSPHHMMTNQLYSYTEDLLKSKLTLKEVAAITCLSQPVVKAVDKRRLDRTYTVNGEGLEFIKPEKQSKRLGIDEFSLHKGHVYATVIMDLDTGHVLWLAYGKTKDGVYDFIDHVGIEWMKGVECVASDMNADFLAAFKSRCPWIKGVYDKFHLIKNFNEKVVSEVRKDEQARLIAEGRPKEAERLKRSKYTLMTTEETRHSNDHPEVDKDGKIKKKRRKSNDKEQSLFAHPKKKKSQIEMEKAYQNIIKDNELLMGLDFVKNSLSDAYNSTTEEEMTAQLEVIIDYCEATGNKHFKWFGNLLRNHLEGICNYALYHITTGKVEGTNNMIKTLRRRHYGIPDDDYLFLKIIDESRRRSH